MITVAQIGIFVLLSGLILFSKASDKRQSRIAGGFVGFGTGLLVISAPWWIR